MKWLTLTLVPVAVLASQVLSVWFLAKIAFVAFLCFAWRISKDGFI